MHENIEIFLNRCRACAAFQENMEKMVELFCEKNVSEMFTNCTSLEISSHDYLPSRICFQCYENLTNLNKFRQGCLNSDRFLREQV
ncbi:hypothetical protein Bhyg_03801 [Pseudolycoriella hygida]|uniref:ZAD domain-containing protein n=1 Tax=Pseudolycoriella hygida TaxID=35572 RepID=A0A9Q0NFE3_9DIPT|nr:hypothetical protein Bhyg_03801 [Pseudolycoriella hygida]